MQKYTFTRFLKVQVTLLGQKNKIKIKVHFQASQVPEETTNTTNPDQVELLKREIKIYTELQYIGEESTEFWNLNKNKFSILYRMALKYLSIPATSAPMERLFSYSDYIMRPHRSRLAAEHLNQNTLIRCNFGLISDYFLIKDPVDEID